MSESRKILCDILAYAYVSSIKHSDLDLLECQVFVNKQINLEKSNCLPLSPGNQLLLG